MPTRKQAIETFAEQHDGRLDDYFYLPLRGRNKDIVMALSAKDGRPVAGLRSARGGRMIGKANPSFRLKGSRGQALDQRHSLKIFSPNDYETSRSLSIREPLLNDD